MNDFQTDLSALQEMQNDFAKKKELETQIAKQKNKLANANSHYAGAIEVAAEKPTVDHTESEKLEKAKKEYEQKNRGGFATGMLGATLAIAIIALIVGSGWAKLWGFLAALCFLLGAILGPVGAVIGGGLGLLIGWSTWAGAGLVYQIILGVLAVLVVIASYYDKKEDKKTKPVIDRMQREIDLQKKAEQSAWEQEMAEYEKQLAQAEAAQRALADKMNKGLIDELDSLEKQLAAVKAHIADNPVLDNSDKKEEVVAYVISLLQRKRAVSLTDALQQYDAMILQRDQAMLERDTKLLQQEMEQWQQEQRLQREMDDRWNQAMHNAKVAREQQRQTELLEEINDNLRK